MYYITQAEDDKAPLEAESLLKTYKKMIDVHFYDATGNDAIPSEKEFIQDFKDLGKFEIGSILVTRKKK